MTGQEFIDNIDDLEKYIQTLNASLSVKDGSLLSLTTLQQGKIKNFLSDFKKLLLKSEVK